MLRLWRSSYSKARGTPSQINLISLKIRRKYQPGLRYWVSGLKWSDQGSCPFIKYITIRIILQMSSRLDFSIFSKTAVGSNMLRGGLYAWVACTCPKVMGSLKSIDSLKLLMCRFWHLVPFPNWNSFGLRLPCTKPLSCTVLITSSISIPTMHAVFTVNLPPHSFSRSSSPSPSSYTSNTMLSSLVLPLQMSLGMPRQPCMLFRNDASCRTFRVRLSLSTWAGWILATARSELLMLRYRISCLWGWLCSRVRGSQCSSSRSL